MLRCFSLALTASLLLLGAIHVPADEPNDIELLLRVAYEGKMVRLQALPVHSDIRLDTPEEVQPIDPDAPVHLLIESLWLRKKELQLSTRRIYFYQTIEGEVRGLKSNEEKKYRLRWQKAQPNDARLLEALEQALPLLTGNPADWTDFWPPPKQASPPGEPSPREQPSKEIAPGVFTGGSDVTPPSCKFCPDPYYPKQLRAEKVQGVVELSTTLSEMGRTRGIRLEKSAGHRLLDQAAVETVSHWRFRPATRNGKPIRFMFYVEVNFRLY